MPAVTRRPSASASRSSLCSLGPLPPLLPQRRSPASHKTNVEESPLLQLLSPQETGTPLTAMRGGEQHEQRRESSRGELRQSRRRRQEMMTVPPMPLFGGQEAETALEPTPTSSQAPSDQPPAPAPGRLERACSDRTADRRPRRSRSCCTGDFTEIQKAVWSSPSVMASTPSSQQEQQPPVATSFSQRRRKEKELDLLATPEGGAELEFMALPSVVSTASTRSTATPFSRCSSLESPPVTPTASIQSRDLAAPAATPAAPAPAAPPAAPRVACPGPNWAKGKAVGSGSFGTVYKGLDADTMQIFAVKEAYLEKGNMKSKDRLDSELEICKTLRHPNIICYLGHQYTDTHLFIFLEFAAGGSIASVLKEFGPLSAQMLRQTTRSILQGLDYLHTRSPPVVHRDIKGGNVLVDLNMTAKLADFGCSKCDAETRSFTTVGSIPWMAPEVINNQAGFGRKADVWSFGCTVIEMATAEKPWGNCAFNNMMFALHHIANSGDTPHVPKYLSSKCQDFIAMCTRRSEEERPSTADLLMHAYSQKRSGSKDCPLTVRRVGSF